MKIFQKITINLKKGKSIEFNLFGFTIIRIDTIDKNNTIHLFPYCHKMNFNKSNFFYLKVNLESDYAMLCLQHWVNVISCMEADFCIICDKESLKTKIKKNIVFFDNDIKFISSIRKPLQKIIKNITTKIWEKAGYAHLTTFYHAKKHNIERYWNIDADDTMILAEPCCVAEILTKAQNYAVNNNITLFSLDMWRSRGRKKNWTFGVTYTQNIDKMITNFNKSTNCWKKDYLSWDNGLNIDWYVTYLKDINITSIETFYVENTYFIHWCRQGNFLNNVMGSYMCIWKNGFLKYPFLADIYKNSELGLIPIADDCVKIDCNINEYDCLEFAFNYLTNIKRTTKALRKLWHINTNNYYKKEENIC